MHPVFGVHLDCVACHRAFTRETELVLQLELAASAGAVVIIAIIVIVVHAAISTGFPAISSGELPLYTLQVLLSPLPFA